jgi:hypothetical protein
MSLYFHTEVTGNDPHQNASATWTQVKALHKQQNSHNTKRYSNQSGPMEYNCEVQLPLQT